VTVRHFFEGLSREGTIKAAVEETLTLLEQFANNDEGERKSTLPEPRLRKGVQHIE